MASKRPTPIAASLDEFSERVAQFFVDAGHADPKFADMVRLYVHDKRVIDVVAARRKAIMEEIKPFAERGATVRFGDRILKQTKPTAVKIERSVSSAQVSKAHPRLWEAAKMPTPYASFALNERNDALIVARVHEAVGSADVPLQPGMRLDDLASMYLSEPSTKELVKRKDITMAKLDDIARLAMWDGLPVTFTDGGSVQLKRLQYSSDQLRIIAPELWETLAVEKSTGGVQRWYFGNVHGEDRDDDGE